MSVIKKQAVPGNSMFSYNLITKDIEFVATVFFHPKEVNRTVKYYIVPKQENKIYLQATSPMMARIKFESFLNHRNNVQQQKDKEVRG